MAMNPPPRGFGIRPPRAPGLAAPKIRAPKVAPPTDLQVAQRQVAAAYDPVLQQIKDAYANQATASGNAINAGAQQLAGLYGQYGPQSQAAYDKAAQGMAAVNGMLAGVQAGQGAAQQADLAHQLQGIDTGTVGRVSGDFGQALAGQSLANATKGSNNLALLLGEGAHAGDYGAKLPGIAGGIGFNALRGQENTINQSMADELNKLAAQEPGAVQDALGNIQSNRAKNQQLGFEDWYKQQVLGNTTAKTNASIAQGNARVNQAAQNERDRVAIAQTNAALRAEGIAATNARAQASLNARVKQGARPSPSLSRVYGYIVDANGNAIPDANGQHIPVKASSKSGAGVPPWAK